MSTRCLGYVLARSLPWCFLIGVLLPSKVDKEPLIRRLPFSCMLKACSQCIHVDKIKSGPKGEIYPTPLLSPTTLVAFPPILFLVSEFLDLIYCIDFFFFLIFMQSKLFFPKKGAKSLCNSGILFSKSLHW